MGKPPTPDSLADRPPHTGVATPATTHREANPDRGSLLGIMISAVAGVAWAQWAADGATGAASAAMRVAGLLIGLFILIWSGRRWRRAPGAGSPTSELVTSPRSKPIFSSNGFLVVNAVQVVAFGVGGRLLTSTGHPEYVIAWVATVVGVHFLAFGRLFLTGFYWLGAALITAGLAGLLVGIAGGGPEAIKLTSGLMAASCLFAAGAWSLAKTDAGSPA